MVIAVINNEHYGRIDKNRNVKIKELEMSYLDKLKQKSASGLKTLVQQAQKDATRGFSNEDNRFWKIERDATGNASAIIRFLPISEADADDERALPWVVKQSYGFKSDKTGMWYVEDSPLTIGGKDPVADYVRPFWNTGIDSDKEYARTFKKNTNYYSNIYVVKDPQHPENEGKVFLFRYGKKIYDKILQASQPDESFGDDPIDPFDLFSGNGADFRLKVTTVQKYANYDSSSFTQRKALMNSEGKPFSDEELAEIASKGYSLLEMIAPEKFKSYDELKARFDLVRGEAAQNFLDSDEPIVRKKEEPKQEKVKESSKKVETKKVEPEEDSTTDDLDFDSLLNDLDAD